MDQDDDNLDQDDDNLDQDDDNLDQDDDNYVLNEIMGLIRLVLSSGC